MGRTVFFSWQSDRPSREGRNVIEKALEEAVVRIAKDVKVEEAVREGLRVDKDTKDVPGSPPIFQTILRKIDEASVFVADLTMCGVRSDGGPTPNPNVLIEFGWALKSLGFSQILTVMNAAHGEPTRESMPFDLASLRFPITYNLPDGASSESRNAERAQLSKTLETALRGILLSEEFKKTLPKAPNPAPFPRRDPLNGKARFRPPQRPLGFVRDPVAKMVGAPRSTPVHLAEGPAIWLRLMPLYNPGRTWLTQDLRRSVLMLANLPLMQSAWSVGGSVGLVQDEDGCGYFSLSNDEKTNSVAYVFNTAEVWIISTWFSLVPDCIHFQEKAFVETLESCALLLGRLVSPMPYQWIVGMENVRGRKLVIPGSLHRTFDLCLANVIEEEGTYKKDDKAVELLRGFFEKVFDQCGAQRPSNP